MNKLHIIKRVIEGSIAEEFDIEPGDALCQINGEKIEDIFDYQFMVEDEYLEMLIKKPSGEEWLLEIDKDIDEDIGLEFENGLMDDYRHCCNKCIFCFIDQMPTGMRETLYFKDDDSRLSFLQGNYVTLTNMKDKDINRIVKYHLSPINISFQTTNPELRCKMLNNRFAGEALKKVDILYEAGITMNGQIVLCKGVNDREELVRSIKDLMEYAPVLESVSIVPVGLSKYRDNLYPLEPFGKEDAKEVIETVREYQKIAMDKYDIHFIHASDEFYLLADEDLPEEEIYDGYLQLENGVGMLRLFINEFEEALLDIKSIICDNPMLKDVSLKAREEISLATGKLAYPYIVKFTEKLNALFPNYIFHTYEITNNFFGERITVAGLLTGQDIIEQLKDKKLGDRLILPEALLRSGEEVLLDDVTISDIETALQVKIDIVKSSGWDFVKVLVGEVIYA